MPEVQLKLTSDSKGAEVGIDRTRSKLAAATKEEKKYIAEGDAIGDMAADWIRNTKAIEANAAAIRKARAEQKQMAAAQSEQAKMIGMVPGLKGLGTMMGGSTLDKVGLAMGAVGGVVAAMGKAFVDGQTADATIARIDQHTGGQGAHVFSAMQDLAGRFGGDSQELLTQSERLVRSGFTSEQSIKVMQHAVVAAQGDVGKMEGLLDELVEAASRGYIEESLLSNLEKNGINVRNALMEHLNMSKDQLDEALSQGKIDVSTYLGLIDQLTGAGTDAYEASQKAASTTLGQLKNIWADMKSAWIGFGQALERFIITPLANRVLPLMQKVLAFARDFWDGPDATAQLISETPEAFKQLNQQEEKDKISERFEAQQQMKAAQEARAAQQQTEQEAAALRRDFQKTREAAAWSGVSLAARRATIGRNTGLGNGVSLAALDQKILTSDGYQNPAATAEQVAQLRLLVNERKRLVELLKLENAEQEKLKKQEEQLAAAADRRAAAMDAAGRLALMQEAELAGDAKTLAKLQSQEAAEQRYQQLVKDGVASDTAMEIAAQEVARKQAIQAMSQKPAATGPRAAGWLESELSAVGGGGIRVRDYEAGAVDIARDTKKNTENIADSANSIFEFLKQNYGERVAVVG